MACSRFEYVKNFEQETKILKNCWAVLRIDGRGFTEFCSHHNFEKPNDDRCLQLMNKCASEVMKSYGDMVIAYGHSDEYSFVLKRDANIWNRREVKIVTTVVSLFSSCFVFYWPQFFVQPLQYPPSFDGRIICYPTNRNLKDYLAWRQADCHINNQYNVCFWNLVDVGKRTRDEAYEILKGTVTSEKNEMLFEQFGINYNNLCPLHRKGTVIIKVPKKYVKKKPGQSPTPQNKIQPDLSRTTVTLTSSPCEIKNRLQQDNEEELQTMENVTECGHGKKNNRICKAGTLGDVAAINSDDITPNVSFLPIPEVPGLLELNVDIIKERFWKHYPFLIQSEDG